MNASSDRDLYWSAICERDDSDSFPSASPCSLHPIAHITAQTMSYFRFSVILLLCIIMLYPVNRLENLEQVSLQCCPNFFWLMLSEPSLPLIRISTWQWLVGNMALLEYGKGSPKPKRRGYSRANQTETFTKGVSEMSSRCGLPGFKTTPHYLPPT